MHRSLDHNHPVLAALNGSALVTFRFPVGAPTDEVHTLPAGLARSALALADTPPHPLAQLQLRRAITGVYTSNDADMGIAGHLAQHAQEVLEARWMEEPWRWDREQATYLFTLMRTFTQDVKGLERDKVQAALIESADFVARALMVPPAAEQKLMTHGPTTHEMALMRVIQCATSILSPVEATELHAGITHNSLDGCRETLGAALAMVRKAAMPSC